MRNSTPVLLGLLLGFHLAQGQQTLSQGWDNDHFQHGLDFVNHRLYGSAYNAFDDFLEVNRSGDSRISTAEYYRAYCALILYHTDGEKMMERYVSEYPGHPKAILAYYDMACFFYNEKNYGKATGYFGKVDFPSLSNEQQNAGRFRWGYSLFSQRNLLEALDQFNTIKASGGQYGPASSYYSGFIESSTGDYDNALIDLKRAEANDSYASIVPVLIASVYAKQGRDDELLKYMEIVIEKEGISSLDELNLLTAEAWFRKKEFVKAHPRYRYYLESRENASRQILYRAGYAAAVVGEDEVALALLKQSASDVDSVGMYASYLLGSLYLKRQEKSLALTAFETAKKYKKDPRMAEESLFLSAKLNYDLGKPDIAINEFEEVLKVYPQSAHSVEIRELLSQAYVNANNFNKAIEYIESLSRRTPSVDLAYQKATFLKGTELFNKEDYAQAATYFAKSLEFPLDAKLVSETSYWFGETYSLGLKYEEAVPLYERALESASSKAGMVKQVRYGLGYARYNLQQYDKALVNFKDFIVRATSDDPNYADGMLRLADCQYILKAYGEALVFYRKIRQLNSVDADYAQLQIGLILAFQRRYDEAANEFEGVVRHSNSRYADEAQFQLGQLDFERGKYAPAIAHFTRLITTAKTTRFVPYALSRRAAANYNLKEYGKTADDYISVIQKFPTHPVAQDLLLPLQESLNMASRGDEFNQYLSHFKHANPDAKGIEGVEFESSKSLYFSQYYAKAIGALSAFIANYPDSPHLSEARYYEAESYYRLKDLSKCLDLHQQIAGDAAFALRSKVVARIAELQFKKQHYDLAVASFLKLGTLATNKKEEYTALQGLMESYYLLANYDSADAYARRIQLQGSVNASVQIKASLFLGKSAKARGDYETAKDEFLTTLNSAQDEHGAEAKYLLAEIFFLQGEHKQCNETLLSLNTDFPGYDEWVGRSYLLLADNYVATGETFQAKATLKSLVENFPKENIRDQARAKLKSMEEVELKKSTDAKSDSAGNQR